MSAATLLYLCYVASLGVVGLLAAARGIEFGILSRDPNNLAGAPFYTGALSNLGVLLWWAAAGAGILGGLVLRRADVAKRIAELLLGAGVLSGILALDDVYLIHELAAPEYLGVPELLILGGYAVLAAGWTWRHRHDLLKARPHLLAIAFAGLAISIVIDEGAPWIPFVMIWEDGAKLMGIGAWCAWVCGYAYLQLTGSVVAASRADADPRSPACAGTHACELARAGLFDVSGLRDR